MKILIDIGHPAHVHLFKYLIEQFRMNGNEPLVTVRDIPAAKELLNIYEIPYINLGSKSASLKGKLINQFKYNLRLNKIVKENRIDLAIGTSITIAHVSKISKVKSIVFDDDDDNVQPLMTRFGHPFADIILSPDILKRKGRKKETVYYSGYHELAYLHPNRFNPEPLVLKEAGIKDGESYFILRFNSFKAHHDIGVQGLSIETKWKLVNLLSKHGKVFITTERNIDPEFETFLINISPNKIHSFIYYSTMLIGDSQTMTSEAAVLGVPALKCNSFAGELSVPNEIENKYDLCYSYKPEHFDKMLHKTEELLKRDNLKQEWQIKRKNMLNDKIDVSGFFIWLVENYPHSVKEFRENPNIQFQFR